MHEWHLYFTCITIHMIRGFSFCSFETAKLSRFGSSTMESIVYLYKIVAIAFKASSFMSSLGINYGDAGKSFQTQPSWQLWSCRHKIILYAKYEWTHLTSDCRLFAQLSNSVISNFQFLRWAVEKWMNSLIQNCIANQ